MHSLEKSILLFFFLFFFSEILFFRFYTVSIILLRLHLIFHVYAFGFLIEFDAFHNLILKLFGWRNLYSLFNYIFIFSSKLFYLFTGNVFHFGFGLLILTFFFLLLLLEEIWIFFSELIHVALCVFILL